MPTPAGLCDGPHLLANLWQRPCVESLRAAVRGAGDVEEFVKWGHLVYM